MFEKGFSAEIMCAKLVASGFSKTMRLANPRRQQFMNKVIALVERSGRARSIHVNALTLGTIRAVLGRNVLRTSELMTDASNIYRAMGREFASHQTVNHSIYEFARGVVSTNTVEGYFVSALQRGSLASLSCRVRFPVFKPRSARLR
jgi:ISXO2-like transposase domain